MVDKERGAVGYRILALEDGRATACSAADMAAAADSVRVTYLDAVRAATSTAPSRQASVAQLIATAVAVRATADAVQVLGGYGYHP